MSTAEKTIRFGGYALTHWGFNGGQIKISRDNFASDGACGWFPISLFRGLTIRDILAKAIQVNLEVKAASETAAALAKELGCTFGAIGNIERWGDDMCYSIYLPHPGRVGTYADRVGSWSHTDLATVNWDDVRAQVVRRLELRSQQEVA